MFEVFWSYQGNCWLWESIANIILSTHLQLIRRSTPTDRKYGVREELLSFSSSNFLWRTTSEALQRNPRLLPPNQTAKGIWKPASLEAQASQTAPRPFPHAPTPLPSGIRFTHARALHPGLPLQGYEREVSAAACSSSLLKIHNSRSE